MKKADTRQEKFSEGQRISGYLVTRCVPFKRIDAVVVELQHETTGARHLHIANNDMENAFGVTFKTVPRDSTGVAHILEHTVLCGSKRFPVRDPFFSMLKRSLSTFMNAFTAPDATIYPFSTQNRKDFYNLMDVYLDAVFYPKLDPLSFKQEGHRLEIEGDSANSQELPDLFVMLTRYKAASDANRSQAMITVSADNETKHQRVIDVMNACAAAGIKNITFSAATE